MSLLAKDSRRRHSLKKKKSKSIDVEYTSSDLPALRRKRTIAFKRLSKALEVGTSASTDPSNIDLFLSYYQDIKVIAANFEDAHLTILEILDDPENEDSGIQESFDEMYYQILSINRNLTKNESSSSSNSSSNIRLPKIVLPTFSGNIKQFPEYFDTFNALIHNSKSLSETEKFHYLISSLSGDALSLVRAFPLTHEHYRDAYEALSARYKCKRDLAFTCWRDLLNIDFRCGDANLFRKSLDLFEENLCILKTINLPTLHWDFILVYHILSKLDTKLRRDFEEKHSETEFPSYIQLKSFLQSKCEALLRDTHFSESVKINRPVINRSNEKITSSSPPFKRVNVSHTLVAANDDNQLRASNNAPSKLKCSYCSEPHSISTCAEFLNKSCDDRMKIATEKNWCYNCLKPSHQLKDCKSIFSCRTCKRKHHTLLHRDKPIKSNQSSSSLVSRSPTLTTVLLATAVVQIQDASGNMQSFRAIFDTGSQNNLITESAVKRLQLIPTNTSAQVSGLGDHPADLLGDVTCTVGTNDKALFTLTMHVITRICGDQPISKLNTSGWSHIQSLPLADPGFDIPGSIDLLFAADVFAESLLNQRIKGTSNQPTAFNSVFGWLLLGRTRLATNTLVLTSLDTDNELNSLVQNFWELDSISKPSLLTPDELSCENKYVSDHSRDSSGRYIVRLPFRNDSEPIFEGTRDVALRRFFAIERKLSRDPSLCQQYGEFMSDYIQSGHMSVVPADELNAGKYYIPHHCVLRPDSATTRLRVVFDASAKDVHSRSLNDSQHTGPKLQPNILDIILRFRAHNIVFMCDVRQMYRQILVASEHRDYQRIFWRGSPNDPLQEYRLNTVTYGVSSSPFLACRTLRQLADDDGDSYPLAKRIILSDVYIDDAVTGFDNYETSQLAKNQLIALFKLGGFELRKWVSNDPNLLSDLPISDRLSGSVSLDNSESLSFKVLGLRWDPSTDSFLFQIASSDRPCTKRGILSELARIFDPLGYLSPITIQIKSYIQKLWIIGIGWDQTPPDEVISTWNKYKNQLPELGQLRIPRRLTRSNANSYELHGFCDSSETAYGAVIYLRVTEEDGSVHVFFVCSKARVVPLKRISLPRLELCAAVLLSELYSFVRNTYFERIPIAAVYLWSDSTVVLSWLRSHPSRWATFVANRVSHIQGLTPVECWHHVASGDNPADICSRGQFPRELLHNSLWWAGPSWLALSPEAWPFHDSSMSHFEHSDDIVRSEERKSLVLVSNDHSTNELTESNLYEELLNRFSSLRKLINIVTYIYRFINNSRYPQRSNRDKFLNNVERHQSLLKIVKYVQSQVFASVILALKNQKSLSKPFRKLNPFIDKQGVLRVGGRISKSGLEYEHKHPAFLPSDHNLTFLIIDHIHQSYCHTGVNTTHFLLLQQFWIVSAKRTIRRRLSKCIQCFRTNPQPLQPFMSELPSFRLNEVKPFSVVGVDFAGPFRTKVASYRNARIEKSYLCLFVCLATKAVHLEVVSTLSTDGFIATLRRFVGRRGRCSVIHADCGTNFVGARNLLSSIQQASNAEKISFKFNSPSAPHHGGVWEIQIKAAKTHLYRVIGDQALTFEELTTLFVQIEAMLNSRPLYQISSDPNDISCLTPGHFLTLEPLTAVPDEDLLNTNITRLHRWQMLQALQQSFWSRWKNEYLNSLTQRAKWTKHSKPLSMGSMVIIKDDNRSPLQWALARVVELKVGGDGVARSAIVKTANNTLIQRPLVKLCPLPIED